MRACDCGKVAKWAFDPGGDMSTQLFWSDSGIAFANNGEGSPRCARCGSALSGMQPVELSAEARISGDTIGLRACLNGYVCPSCGLEQAPAGTFDMDNYGLGAEGAKALKGAIRSVGLDV